MLRSVVERVVRVNPVVVLVDFTSAAIHHNVLIVIILRRNMRAHQHAHICGISLRRLIELASMKAACRCASNA